MRDRLVVSDPGTRIGQNYYIVPMLELLLQLFELGALAAPRQPGHDLRRRFARELDDLRDALTPRLSAQLLRIIEVVVTQVARRDRFVKLAGLEEPLLRRYVHESLRCA